MPMRLHMHACICHPFREPHTSTTFNHSCLHNQVVMAASKMWETVEAWPLLSLLKCESCFSARLSRSQVKYACCWRHFIISQILERSMKGFPMFRVQVACCLFQKWMTCVNLSALLEMQFQAEPFTCVGAFRCYPTLKVFVVSVLIRNFIPCCRYKIWTQPLD